MTPRCPCGTALSSSGDCPSCKAEMVRPSVLDQARVHEWFGLSYAQYLTIPRSVLQSMPQEWQARFVECLEQLDDSIDWRPVDGRYWVQLRDSSGRIRRDPLADYERGRRRIIGRKWRGPRERG